ncbi:MAG TPA: M28 family peptidase [Pyrinomonadaceae bacterium]
MKKLNSIIAALLMIVNAGFVTLPARAQTNKTAKNTTPTVFENPALVKKYQRLIVPESLAARLHFLASDLLEGRETGARGARLAAQYLASQYRQLGLAPPRNGGKIPAQATPESFFQPFKVYREMPHETRLEVSAGGKPVATSVFSAEKADDLSYFLSGGAKSADGALVFAGYGIADDRLSYNDLKALADRGISIDGKWVMILADEPLENAAASRLPTADKKPSSWSAQYIYKRAALLRAGRPKGILLVTDQSPRLTGTFAENAAKVSTNARRIGALSLYETSDVPQTFAVSTKFANRMLAASGKTIEALRGEIDRTLEPVVFDVADVSVKASIEASKPLETENVLAFIEGADPELKQEVVIVSAHYDHLGLDPQLAGDQIFNGAADDGSGTVATLELANAFMRAKRDGFAPRRSLLFINFAGEEKGLLGSSHYTYVAPVVPLDKTVADINLDGVGGMDANHPTKSRNYIYVASAEKLSDELLAINRQAHRLTGSSLEITDGNNRGFRSDSEGFQNQLVPFIYYSSGKTEHYHRPSDGADTIDYEHLTRVTQLIFASAWQIANQTEKISSVDRSRLKQIGYVCPPCPFDCEAEIHATGGICAVCGMTLMPKYAAKTD